MPGERRRHSRADISWPATLITPHGPIAGTTQNICLGGAFIRCSEAPDLDDKFRLVIKPTEKQLMITTAEMIWSDTFISDTSIFHGMGVQFKYIPDDDRKFLGQTISDHL